MTFSEWSDKKKKKKEEEAKTRASAKTTKTKSNAKAEKPASGMTFSEWSNAKYGFADDDIAPVKKTTVTTAADKDERKWFEKGAFEDGYQFGDVMKTILGTGTDVAENLSAGVIGMGEKLVDAGAYLAPLFAQGQFYQNGGAYQPIEVQQEFEKSIATSKKGMSDFIQKDLYDEEKVAKKIVLGTDENSVLGEKSDALIQSGGQLLATAGLQAVGVPWFVTTGATSFGSQAETALKEGASYEEAGASAAISAGAEILTEKLSGGIKFGGKTLDDVLLKPLTEKIASKTVRTLVNLGADAVGEGLEEIASGAISNLGEALYKEENLGELLFSKEALYEYIESFLGGFVLGGAGSGVKAIRSRNSIELTEDEQKVVEHEYEKRIADQELTERQKHKIHNDVVHDMLRGYISTDTIEEVLGGDEYTTFMSERDAFFGGETYKAYKDTITSEEAQIKEIEAQMEKLANEPNTVANARQYDALQSQIDQLRNSAKRAELKAQLDSEAARIGGIRNQLRTNVADLVKDSRLAESYRELARSKEKFTADLSKYENEHAKKTIQNIMDSGVAVNTNEFHEFADWLAKISEDKGMSFSTTNTERLKGTRYAFEGKVTNGFVDENGNVTLNIDSDKAGQITVGHELTHVLEGTEFYAELQSAIKNYAISKMGLHAFNARLKDTENRYKGIGDPDKELTADLIGEYLFTDTDFVRNLSVQHRNVFRKIYDEIKYLCKVATAGSKEARELEKVKRAFEDAYRANVTEAQTDTKYSLENGGKRKYNNRSRYSETETLFLSWENGPAPVGEVKRFVRFGKVHYYEKTENGCVELSRKQYNERNGKHAEDIDRRAEREIGKTADYDVGSQRGTTGYPDSNRYTGGTAAVFGQTFREELPDVTGRGTSGTLGHNLGNDIKQSEYNKEASEESDASFTFSNDYATIRNYMKEGDISGKADSAHVEYTTEGEVSFSLSNDTAYMDKAIAANNAAMTVDSKIMEEAKVLRAKIAGRMNEIKDRGLVALPDDVEGNTYIANSSYDGTEENTTICPRSLASEAFVDAVSEYLGRPLTVEEQIYISQDLQGRTLTPECLYCYVATDRKAYRAFLGEYVKQRDAVLEKLKADPNADVSRSGKLYNEFRNGRKDTDPMYNRFRMWVDAYKNGKPMIDGNHLANINKLMGDINSEFGAELKPQIVDAMKYAQSASWAKKRVNYVAYNGHILKWKQNRINKLNSHYGLRMYSFSDFHPAFVLENMQMITDASVRGLKMLGYTKDTDFVEIFAPTGMNINVSTFGFESGGQVFENNITGASWETAKALREKYPNVGVTFVATNDTIVEWALAQDWIDVVIPYHLVRTGAEVAKALNYTNYTGESSDTKAPDWKKGDAKYIAPTEHNNDKATYLAALAKNHLEPRFKRFLSNPNYMKLVNECRQSASESKPVQPIFNEDAAMKALAKLEANGYYQPIGGSVDRMYEIAAEVAESMTQELAPAMSLSDAGETPDNHGLAPLNKFRHGSDVYGEDIRLEAAPVAETAAENAAENAAVAPVGETVSKTETVAEAEMFPDDAAPVEQELDRLVQEQDALEAQMLEMADNGDFSELESMTERWNGLRNRIAELEAEAHEADAGRLNSLGDADAPPEQEAPYSGAQSEGVQDPFADRDYSDVGKRSVKAYMYENPEVRPFFQKEAGGMLDNLRNSLKGERWYNDAVYYESGGERGWGGTKRHTTEDIAYLLDGGYTYAQIEKGLNAIIEDNGAENNAVSKRIEFALNDRLLYGYRDLDGRQIPPNPEYARLIQEKQINAYSREAFDAFMANADRYAPPAESVAPVAQPVQKAPVAAPVKAPAAKTTKPSAPAVEESLPEAEHIAKIRRADTKANKESWWSRTKKTVNEAVSVLGDKGWVFENLGKKTGNREIEAKFDFMNNRVKGAAQEYLNERLLPIYETVTENSKRKGKVAPVKEVNGEIVTDYAEQFEYYARHLLNVDRMSLETEAERKRRAEIRKLLDGYTEKQIESVASERITVKTPEDRVQQIHLAQEYIDLGGARGKNKPVFGSSVTADVSRKRAEAYEAAHPEFKILEQAILNYNQELRQLAVREGLITQKTADKWAKMYPHYVPIRRTDHQGASVSVPLDAKRTGVNNPFKRAKGGNSDFIPLLDTMAMNTEQIFRAVARNDFGKELMGALDSIAATSGMEADASAILENTDDNSKAVLEPGKKGQPPQFTVFVKGKAVTFDITEEMYKAMQPAEGILSETYAIPNKLAEAYKKVLTQYDPFFAFFRNPVKDAKDVLFNSQHAFKTYATAPKAFKEIATKGRYYTEFVKNGGNSNTYYDTKEMSFTEQANKKTNVYNKASENFEMFWRLSEYIASRESGRSEKVSMLDAARVTTNFGAGGDFTKWLNRNGAMFLNPSVQGVMQNVRNVREAYHGGLKGSAILAAKVLATGLGGMFFNWLLWDDDDEYAELSDYVKQNYYIVGKYGDGKFIRIPKGRMEAVIQNGFEQIQNLITGNDDVDMAAFASLVANNLAPNNPLEDNLIAPIAQAWNNKTWYKEDLVPTSLQDLPAEEQFDETTDSISKWLGEKLGWSPYKINYVIQQYGGGFADMVLPFLTDEAEGDSFLAPIRDQFVSDSVLKNQNVSDFYTKKDELTVNANASGATDEDVLMSKYMNSVNADLAKLYAAKREIQSSTDMSDAEKYEAVRDIQKQIVDLTKAALGSYDDISFEDDYREGGEYARMSGKLYKLNKDGEWQKLSADEVTKYEVTKAAGDASYATDGKNHYRWYVPGEDAGKDAKPGWRKITEKELERQEEVTDGLGISPEDYWNNREEYCYAFDNPESYAVAKAVGGYDAYRTYSSELYDIKADKDEYGKSISGSRKEKVLDYINNLDADYYTRIILWKSEYTSDDSYNEEIIDYLNGRDDLSFEERIAILRKLGFDVTDDGDISW